MADTKPSGLVKTIIYNNATAKTKLSDLEGKLSHETAEAIRNYVAESRNGWEERLKKQFLK